ncbi:MAG: 2,3-bisphosphoglycerate-independent phosphoglycerate mutase [candidate division WS6 bacterium OLB20]|uniref:2,3-bisphosphoglycerate-independent phosphoglycerate mutase n=1 Tax=candidate division WS6 bacterium OLB20 TaxID=1617426 RepID=A0A136M062_9BACT|nr:MAG: 2,3-bisphosphoglycerate-independent phosphoglycerate mutase [candidate division WS6 bacterium OLB20]
MFTRPKPVLMLFMDGVGVAPPSPGNAVSLAKTPNLDYLWPTFPHTYLHAAGLNVGLPHGVDGNSEVGHMNLGAGKVIFQELPRIDNAISSETFFKNQVLIDAFNRSHDHNVHIMGLVGTGQVHSSFGHLIALLEMAQRVQANGDNVYVHIFTDGRDSKPQGVKKLLERLEVEMKRTGTGQIASLIGRYYAMDRDERWERTRKAYELIAEGKGTMVKNWKEALDNSYKQEKFDEYVEPYVIARGGEPMATVKPGDAVIFYNYRPDRAVQITRAFEDANFPGWERLPVKDLFFVGLSNYEKGFPKNQAFPPERITSHWVKCCQTTGFISYASLSLKKFPHVTYFLNGGNQIQYPGEDRIEVPSPRDVATYDQKPEMSTYIVTELIINKIKTGKYDLIMTNFANPDMVGHTGVLDGTIKAMEVVDECIGKLMNVILPMGGAIVITADHGNAEELIDLQSGNVDTKHSTNPVPLIVAKQGLDGRELSFGILADVAPTVLGLLGIQKPPEMTGRNLLV